MTATAFAADPTGAWKWTAQGRNGAQDYTMKLELKGGALTGALMMPGRGGGAPTEVAISEASFKSDEIAFSVVREFNGMKMVTKYSGKLAGDENQRLHRTSGPGRRSAAPEDRLAREARSCGRGEIGPQNAIHPRKPAGGRGGRC